MKRKVVEFSIMFVGYCLLFLTWNNWNPTGKQIVEMIFIGILSGLFSALTITRLTRFIESIVRKLKI